MTKIQKQQQARTNQILNFVAARNKPARFIATNNAAPTAPFRFGPIQAASSLPITAVVRLHRNLRRGPVVRVRTRHNTISIDRSIDRSSERYPCRHAPQAMARLRIRPCHGEKKWGTATAPGFRCTTVHGWTNGGRRASHFGKRAMMQTETNGSWRRGADGRTAAEIRPVSFRPTQNNQPDPNKTTERPNRTNDWRSGMKRKEKKRKEKA